MCECVSWVHPVTETRGVTHLLAGPRRVLLWQSMCEGGRDARVAPREGRSSMARLSRNVQGSDSQNVHCVILIDSKHYTDCRVGAPSVKETSLMQH